jgi:hypothetical protein
VCCLPARAYSRARRGRASNSPLANGPSSTVRRPSREKSVRNGLAAGGSRIRTLGSSRAMSPEKVETRRYSGRCVPNVDLQIAVWKRPAAVRDFAVSDRSRRYHLARAYAVIGPRRETGATSRLSIGHLVTFEGIAGKMIRPIAFESSATQRPRAARPGQDPQRAQLGGA